MMSELNPLLSYAEEVALQFNAYALSTEHILYAMVALAKEEQESKRRSIESFSFSWLTSTCDDDLLKALEGFFRSTTTMASPTPKAFLSDRTPSAERLLEIFQCLSSGKYIAVGTSNRDALLYASLLVTDYEKPTAAVGVLRSLLLARKIPFVEVAQDKFFIDIIGKKFDDVLHCVPPRSTRAFGITIDEGGSVGSGALAGPPPTSIPTQLTNVHKLYDNIYCGSAPGNGPPETVLNLVNLLHVNVFVCLQTSYEEYGCKDYRETLRTNASRLAHKVSFIHCP
eukprot:PhF_6_TR44479/c0_g1_i2/m.68486